MNLEEMNNEFQKLKPYIGMTTTKVGDLAVYNNDYTISAALILFGEYCHAEVNVMCEYLNSSSLYLDVGTNIGYHCRAVHHQAHCHVIGFEPNLNHFLMASFNCQNQPEIEINNIAVGRNVGTANIAVFDPTEKGNFGTTSLNDGNEIKGQEVNMVSLDSLNLSKCDLIKIDVEGYEFEVLNGAQNLITKFNPVIFYEAQDSSVWTKCHEWLEQLDYKQYWVGCRNVPVDKTFKTPDPNILIPGNKSGVCNILAVPSKLPQPTTLMPVIKEQTFNDAALYYSNDPNMKIIF